MGDDGTTAFVLGGGGRLGAAEVGMLAALSDAGVVPDLVLGTSIGAINGVVVADEPGPGGVARLRSLWSRVEHTGMFGGGIVDRVRHIAATRTSLHSNEPLRRLLDEVVGDRRIEDLAVRFQCVAACIETAEATWFDRGAVTERVLASCAVPGLLPAVQVDGLHYLDGGVVDSIPVRRAIDLGADRIYVLQVGRIEEPLVLPRRPHEVALVAFELARRHSFATAMAARPAGVEVHVLPSGGEPLRFNDLRQLRYRDFSDVGRRIEQAHRAAADYLAGRGTGR